MVIMPTGNADTMVRQSGIPGLIIWGKAGWGYRVMCQPAGEERALDITTRRTANQFRTVGDAKQAAQRLADLLPWNDKPALDTAIKESRQTGTRLDWSIIEGLIGMSKDEYEAKEAARRNAERAWYDGTGPRDEFNATLRAKGHDVTWTRKGERTFWGKCKCGEQFRSSYRSVSRSYHQQYDGGVISDCPANN